MDWLREKGFLNDHEVLHVRLQRVAAALEPKEWLYLVVLVSSIYLGYRVLLGSIGELPAKRIVVELPAAAQPGWKGEVLEKPAIRASKGNDIVCYCPATGQKLGEIRAVTPEDIDEAIAAAKVAQLSWARTTFAQRRQVLKTLLNFVLENQESLARVAARDSGKPVLDASFGEILVTAEKLQWILTHGEAALRPERRPTNFLMSYKRNEVRWEPLGVVAACISWNYPLHNMFGPMIAALFCGNAIVIKPSERTAWSSVYFLSIARAALVGCGHSPDLVHLLPMWPEAADHLTSHPDISHITFIGSRPVAKHVLAAAAKPITPVCVELGGKDPFIVLDDAADLPGIADVMLRGTFQSAGQNCIGIERIIACPKVYQKLIDLVQPKIQNFRLGSGLDDSADTCIDMGAMVSGDNFEFLEKVIAEAVAAGAKLLAGGKRYHHPKHPSGHYFTPTLLVDVTPDMRIAQEELFSPVCLIMKAKNTADAIAVANSTEYGLGASVFGRSRRDIEAVVSGVKSGMIAVNDFAVYYAVQLPFGGVKGSGYGRFAGEEGLRSMCNTKAVCRDRLPGIIETKIPPPHRYPIRDMQKAWLAARGVVLLGYGGLVQKAKGLWGLVTNL